jgi:hypothetical protein
MSQGRPAAQGTGRGSEQSQEGSHQGIAQTNLQKQIHERRSS